jgi:hypothetical protein
MTDTIPETRAAAAAIGARQYRGSPCKRAHAGLRYTKGGACIECVRIARGGWEKSRRRSAENMSLSLDARSGGRTTYFATRPCRHGHFERFVVSNNCIACNRAALERGKIIRKFARIRGEYGLDREAYLALVSEQRSSCRICGFNEPDHFKLHVDHCHDTGRVRGLLCGPCNQGIGLMRHSSERLRHAIVYLGGTPQ